MSGCSGTQWFNKRPTNMVTPALVSIGLPVYNCREFVKDTISALLAQTYEPIELVISDNASDDGTTEIVRAAAIADPRIRLEVQPVNRGMVGNFEIVRKMARGTYFFWAGGDDLWHERFIEVLIRELEAHPEATLAMTATQRVDAHGRLIDQIRYGAPHDPNTLSPVAQAKRLIAATAALRHLKYNMYYCGLFRMEFLNRVLDRRPDLHFGGDRPLPCIAALSGGLRYVDEPYLVKRVYCRSFGQRYPDDIYNNAKARTRFWASCRLLVEWIWCSPTISAPMKLAAPFAILAPVILHRCRINLIDSLPERVRFILRRVVRTVLLSR